jgi:hypothetical protein
MRILTICRLSCPRFVVVPKGLVILLSLLVILLLLLSPPFLSLPLISYINLSRINDDHAGGLDMLVQELEAALLRRALEVVPVRPVQSALGFRERFEEPEPEPAMRPWRVAVGVVQQRQRALLEFHVRLL